MSSLVVGIFEREAQAHQVVNALRQAGVAANRMSLLPPGGRPAEPRMDLLGIAWDASDTHALSDVLVSLGLPDGEARFYAHEADDGRTLLAVDASDRADAIREMILAHGGYDVRSRGGELARPEGAGVAGGTGPRPIDVTGRWDDVRSRYEMLWQQHYGTTDATWEQMEPIYRYAWQVANDPKLRGRPWSDVESTMRRDWEKSPQTSSWDDAAGPLRDVWEDVAEEAATGAEGGADRRIPRQGTDQSLAARSLQGAP